MIYQHNQEKMASAVATLLLLLLFTLGSHSEEGRTVYTDLANPASLKFFHTLDHVTLIHCYLNKLEVFNWYPKIGNSGTFVGSLQNRAQFVTGSDSLLLIINSVQIGDEGPYRCEFVNTPTNTKIIDEIYLGIHSRPEYEINISPNFTVGNIVRPYVDDLVIIDIRSGCGRPAMKFEVTSPNGLRVASMSTPCNLQQFLGYISTLHLSLPARTTEQLTISIEHPSVAATRNVYHIKLNDLCSRHPCQNNGTCQGDAKTYSCKCKDGFIGQNCDYVIPVGAEGNRGSQPIVCHANAAGNNFGFVILGVFLTLVVVAVLWLIKDYRRYKTTDDGRDEIDMVPMKKKNVKTYVRKRSSQIAKTTKSCSCFEDRSKANPNLTSSVKRDQHNLSTQEMRLLKAAKDQNRSTRYDSDDYHSDAGDFSFDGDEENTSPGGPRPPRDHLSPLKGGGTSLVRKESAIYANLPIKRKAADPKDITALKEDQADGKPDVTAPVSQDNTNLTVENEKETTNVAKDETEPENKDKVALENLENERTAVDSDKVHEDIKETVPEICVLKEENKFSTFKPDA